MMQQQVNASIGIMLHGACALYSSLPTLLCIILLIALRRQMVST
jgi:hypothetical protein